MRCAYCIPEEPVWFDRSRILAFEEIHRLVRIAIGHGVRKVRLTGGEPLLRKDLSVLVGLLANEPGLETLSLTTNAVLLAERAEELAAAGLDRINVSLDTLVPERFLAMTRRDQLPKVLAGIDAARRVGFDRIKINTVLLKGQNDDEVESLVEWARRDGLELRFIEFMPLENGSRWDLSSVVTGDALRERIERRWPLDPDPARDPHAPASRFLYRDGRGVVGFINSISAPFCGDCSRIRLTADGKFMVCLYDSAEVDLRAPIRDGADDQLLSDTMVTAVRGKTRGGALEIVERQSALPLSRTMHQIGG